MPTSVTLARFNEIVSDYGYNISEVPAHFKNNNEIGKTLYEASYDTEYEDDEDKVIARAFTAKDAAYAVRIHAEDNEPEMAKYLQFYTIQN